MILSKQDFFTVHKGYNKKLTCFVAGNTAVYTEKAFLKFSDIIITLSGQDYSVKGDTVTRL